MLSVTEWLAQAHAVTCNKLPAGPIHKAKWTGHVQIASMTSSMHPAERLHSRAVCKSACEHAEATAHIVSMRACGCDDANDSTSILGKPDLDSLHRAGSDSTLPVTLVHKDLHKPGNDAIDVCVEALKAEGCEVAAGLVARNRYCIAHLNQMVIHLQHMSEVLRLCSCMLQRSRLSWV